MKISIITVAFNSAATIGDTLESVRCQSHPDVEHIVVDGASRDNTLEVVERFPHIARCLSEPDRGLYDAMNKGIALASGELIGILNSDDFYSHSAVLAKVAEQIQQSQAAALYADLKYVHPRNLSQTQRYWRAGTYTRDQFRLGWMPPHPTFFVRRQHYETFGDYDLDFRSAADYELMLRFLYKNRLSACYLPEVIVHMRSGGMSNASLAQRWRANREDRRAWIKNGLQPAPYTLWLKPLRKIPQFFS